MFEGFPDFHGPFAEVEDIIQTKVPNKYQTFRNNHMDLIFKLEYLELICLRYENEKSIWEQIIKKVRMLIENPKSISQEENRKLSEQILQYSKLLELEVDSFFIFARILLDRIPRLLKPLYKGVVTLVIPSTINFKTHIDWFQNNPHYVLDSLFLAKMISFKTLFYEKLRDPRNEWVVHSEGKHIRSSINSVGNVEKTRYELRKRGDKDVWTKIVSIEPKISTLLTKIFEFLDYLNKYFYEKLLINETEFLI